MPTFFSAGAVTKVEDLQYGFDGLPIHGIGDASMQLEREIEGFRRDQHHLPAMMQKDERVDRSTGALPSRSIHVDRLFLGFALAVRARWIA